MDVHSNIPFGLFRRKHLLSESSSLPHGFIPFISSSDGNCLFSSVSLILFGDTTHAVELRFAALLHAVQHMAHYLEMVWIVTTCTDHGNYTYCIFHTQLNQEIRSAEDALQFFATVTTSDDVPCDADREQLLKCAIQTEIFSTSKIDSYSGNYPLKHFCIPSYYWNFLIFRSVTDLIFSWCNEVFNCATYRSATGWIQYHCVSLCMSRLHKGYYPYNVGEVLKEGHIPQPHHSFDSRYTYILVAPMHTHYYQN